MTEERSIGYGEGYQDGWNAAMDAKPEQAAPAQDEYKAAYIEAMVASNEAGFSGMTAAETIRELNRMVSEQLASVRFQRIERGEGDWMDCTKEQYEKAMALPEWDTRCFYTPPTPTPAPAQLPPNCGTGYCSCIECLKGKP